MKPLKNEKGVTLIEMLAVIVIIAIFIVILFNIFSSGVSFSEKESSKASMQQQSNYILTVWREYHEDGYPYSVKISNDGKMITFQQYSYADFNETIKQQVVENSNYIFDILLNSDGNLSLINPSQTKTITFKLKITDTKNKASSYEIETKLSRL